MCAAVMIVPVRVALQRGADGVGGAPARELVGVQAGVGRGGGDQPGVVDQAGLHDPDTHTAQQRVDRLMATTNDRVE